MRSVEDFWPGIVKRMIHWRPFCMEMSPLPWSLREVARFMLWRLCPAGSSPSRGATRCSECGVNRHNIPAHLIHALSVYVLEQARALQAIPAPSLAETQRANYLKDQFTQLGFSAKQDDVGNVLVCLSGGGKAPLVLTAHLDSVFSADQVLSSRHVEGRLIGPGIGDNALGLASLLGLARFWEDLNIDLPEVCGWWLQWVRRDTGI